MQVGGLPPRDAHPRRRLVGEVGRPDDAALPEGRPRAPPPVTAAANLSRRRARRRGGRLRAVQGRPWRNAEEMKS